MDNCIFCKIIDGEIPGRKLYEDDKVIVILDAFPLSKGHTLVIPKEHNQNINDMSEELYVHVTKVVRKIRKQLEEKITEANGFVIIENEGKPQEVKHVHFHIVPIYEDNFPIKYNKAIEIDLNLLHEELK